MPAAKTSERSMKLKEANLQRTLVQAVKEVSAQKETTVELQMAATSSSKSEKPVAPAAPVGRGWRYSKV